MYNFSNVHYILVKIYETIENIDVFLLYIVRQLIRERLFDIYSTINMFDLLNLEITKRELI